MSRIGQINHRGARLRACPYVGPLRALRAAALAAALFAAAVPTRADEAQQLERFLSRLGLVDLQILHLEQMVQQQSGDQQVQTVRRLADLYAGRLMEAADDPPRYNELLAGIDALTKRHPQARTTALEVMLLQADYNRAEALVGQWIADAENTAARGEAADILARIAPQLSAHQQELNDRVEQLAQAADDLPEGDQRDEKEKELARLQAVAGRATYFAGWSSYYRGLTRGAAAAAARDFDQARTVFRKLLGLDAADTDYEKVEVEWLGLESVWRARAVIGLGLAEAAAGDLAASGKVFAWLESPAVALQIRDQAAYWYVQGLLNAGHHAAAAEYAAARIDTFSGEASQGKISLCAALVRAGFGASAGTAEAQGRSLGLLGVKGLVKLRQFAVLKTLMDKYPVDLADGGGFYLTWLRGQQQFDAAERSKDPAGYQAAADLFTQALASDEARRDAASAAHCRYNRGWSRYRLGEYLQAAEDFEQAITGLRGGDAETAAQSAWLAFAAHRQLMAASPAAASSAVAMLERIKREFPASKFAQQADYQIARLRTASAAPEQSVAALKKIPPSDANYLAARYDLCLLLYRQWQDARSRPEAAKQHLDELREAVGVFQRAAGGREPERQLAAGLKLVDAALGMDPPDAATAQRGLADLEPLVARVPADDANLAEYHYHALQLARLRGDAAARREHARWIVENGAGSRFEMPALVIVATALERQIEDASEAQRPALYAEALDIYSRLARALGDSPQVLESQKNARVALSKQANYAALLGRHAEAAAALQKLLAVFPTDSDYLRRGALADFHAGRYEASLARWQTLLRGLPAGEPAWLEAKYHQIAALAKTDQPTAAAAYRQFALLYPDLGGDAWRVRFQSLQRQLR